MPPPPSPACARGEAQLYVAASLEQSRNKEGGMIQGLLNAATPFMSSSTNVRKPNLSINNSLDRSPAPRFAHEYPVFTPLKGASSGSKSDDSLEALREGDQEDWLSPLVLDDATHKHALDMETLQHTLYQPGQHGMSAAAARLANSNQKLHPAASATLINRHKIESRPFHITSIHPNRAPMLSHKHKPRIRSAEFSRPDWSTPPSHSSYTKKPLPHLLSSIKASKLMRNSSTKTSSIPPPPPPHYTLASSLDDPADNTQFHASPSPYNLHTAEPHVAASPLNMGHTTSSRAGSSDNGCMQSCDKCLPGSRMTVVPLMDSCDYTDIPPKERDFSDSGHNTKPCKVTNHPFILWFRSKKKPATGSVMKESRSQGAANKALDSVRMEKERANMESVREKLMTLEEGKESLEVAVKSMKKEVSQANEKRDAALVEVFELKMAIEEMGKKLEHLEGYCQNLQNSSLRSTQPFKNAIISAIPDVSSGYGDHLHEFEGDDHDQMLRAALALGNTQYVGPSKKEFYHAVTEARVSIKQFCRTLLQQIQEQPATDKIESILQPYNVKVAPRVSKSVRYYLESLINEAFYEDFENIKFQKTGTNCVLDPRQRPQAFYKTYVSMSQMGWSELVSKESAAYSQSFDAFCDHKMNRVEQVLNWEGRWPDDLARSFFVAAKWVWLLHLLAFAFHHPAQIFRVGPEAHFDIEYMEELLLENSSKGRPSNVAPASSLSIKAMVMPGFFFNNYEVIKCKVVLSRQPVTPS